MNEEKEMLKLRERHSLLCAEAHKLKIDVPDDLKLDFETSDAGRAVCASLDKLVQSQTVAEVGEEEHSGSDQELQEATGAEKPRTKSKKKPAAAPAAAKQQESENMTTKVKKTAKKAKAPAKKKSTKKVVAKKATTKAKGDSKTAWVVSRLRNGGVTRAEVLAKTGWKAVSMQQLAKSAGVKLKVSDERPFRYSAAK